MNCRDVRDRLTAATGSRGDARLKEHLEGCSACRGYDARLRITRGLLRDHRADFEPDPAFAARVIDRLPLGPAAALGWAAVRLLPVSVALVLVLGWLALGSSGDAVSVENAAPTDDLVSWVVEQNALGTDEGYRP